MYTGTTGDKAAMTPWCNWNCQSFCPGDMCKPDGVSNPAPAPAPAPLPTHAQGPALTYTPPPHPAPTPAPAPVSVGSGFGKYLAEGKFKELFPNALPLYTFSGLVDAAKKYPMFANTGNELNDKRELAAFLAQTAHECDHYNAAEEYAKDSYPVTQYCNPSQVPCAPGKRYHGRGPIQLSWNYNYEAVGKALGVDLLNNPELVSSDKSITWQTGLWYWMTPQGKGTIHDVVTKDDGFAQATDIINGSLECGPSAPNKANEQPRIQYYKEICAKMGIQPVSKVSCN